MSQNEQADKAAWMQKALERFEGPLVRYALRLIGNGESARDVVQDTFLRLCDEGPATLNGRLAPWLYAVCRNRALDVVRKERRMEAIAEWMDARPDLGDAPHAPEERREEGSDLLRAVETLPRNQQEVVVLKFQGGLSYKQIAEVTGHSVTHVGVLLHEAIKCLRGRLRE